MHRRRTDAFVALALIIFAVASQAVAAVGGTPGAANVSDSREASYLQHHNRSPGTVTATGLGGTDYK
jgi:hypothetical protein